MDFDTYQQIAESFVTYRERLSEKEQLAYAALGLAGEAGEAAEKLKKIIRDSDSKFPNEEAFEAFIKELGDVLWYITELATQFHISLEDIALLNLKKLQSRKTRGTLQGSGDDR